MSKIKSFKKNIHGKDYICSDIHGHFYLLEQELEKVKFNTKKDRLFCLGDLIDDSDDSVKVLEYLDKPWFFSILGNHEIMLIDSYKSNSFIAKQQWYRWGGEWAKKLNDDELFLYYKNLRKLPIAIELELSCGKNIGLIHANLPNESDWNEVKNYLMSLTVSGFNSCDPILKKIFWEKAKLFGDMKKNIKKINNIDHVFHGHTIVNDYIMIENRTYMDLGSYNTHKLGFIQPDDYLRGKLHPDSTKKSTS